MSKRQTREGDGVEEPDSSNESASGVPLALIAPSPQRPPVKAKAPRAKKQQLNEMNKEGLEIGKDTLESNIRSVASNQEDAPNITDEEMLAFADEFVDVDKLQDGGINVADLRKLKEAGLHSAMSVIYTTKKDLCNIRGLSDAKVEKIQEAARKLTDAGFMSATDFMKKKLSSRFHISTGASNVDKLLGGGIESSSITELFGEFRCGKTQICHSLAVLCQLNRSQGGGQGKCCYIDTENTFRPDRITTIAQQYNLDPSIVLGNIMYARCFNSDHLWQLLVCASAKMAEEKFALIVIDSLMAPFRVDFSGRGELADRQQNLGKFLVKLQKISEEFNLAVVITNQVMSDPGATMTFAANPPKPIGGHILAHFSTTRLALRKGRAEQRIMKIYDSPCLPEGDAVYEICAKGIQDASD
jgi:meiotic recombination protein DMC1